MKYRDILGFPKPKRKVIKEQSKPKKNEIIENVKKELNEWNDTSFRNAPKRWSGASNNGLTEFEANGGKDFIKEVGMSADIKKYQKSIDKDMMNLAKSVNALKDLLIKNGAKKEAQELGSIFVTNVGKFRNFIKVKFIRMIRKLI